MSNFNIDRLSADIDLLNELVEKKDTRITDLKAWQVISDNEIAALQGVINKRDERIAELEEERNELKCKLSHSETMGELEQAKRDLEQQAKGRLDGVAYALNMYCTNMSPKDFPAIGDYYANKLKAKAKELKEQGDE